MKEIVIDIAEDGEIRLETKGFTGKACVEESQFLKDIIGKETFKRLTPAFYNTIRQKVKKYLQLCG